MGYEYKIIIKLNSEEREEINKLIFLKEALNILWGDTIQIKDDGIYVCKHIKPYIWDGLENLKQYIDERKISYKIEEL